MSSRRSGSRSSNRHSCSRKTVHHRDAESTEDLCVLGVSVVNEPLDLDGALVRREPLPEILQLRIQLARVGDIARFAKLTLEVTVELEHVAEVVGAREAEAAIDGGVDGVVAHLFAER